jgi:hypothetical protein
MADIANEQSERRCQSPRADASACSAATSTLSGCHGHHGRYQGHTPRGAPVYNVAFPVEKSTGRPYALIKV